jgi:DNA-binding LytR/AlgR family response regulator
MKFRYLIVDDEPLARKLIQSHAGKVEMLEEAGVCNNAVDAANFLRVNKVDIIFLDIQMPELTGMDFLKSLKHAPIIILTTAHREFAAEAFELEVTDYLVKPISFERFLKAVNKIIEMRASLGIPRSNETAISIIQIKSDRKIFPVAASEIIYIESLDNYVKIYLREKVLITHETITSLEEKLAPGSFVRIHRSFIVNISHVQSIGAEFIQISNKELPFGRVYKQSAQSRLGWNGK